MNEQSQLPKVSYHTLGCKLNFAETSALGRELEAAGFLRAQGSETPDICVINTCSVTETADKKGRQLIRRLVSRYPEATIVVTGCYAQLKPEEVDAIPGVDIVLGTNDKLHIARFVKQWQTDHVKQLHVPQAASLREFMPSCERGDRTRYFLKVQDGCDYWCSYCTIPMARGRSRSGSIAQMVELARRTAREGGREIVLTGVNTGDFGKGTEENFFDLIRALDEVEGISRYRISSIEPNLLTEEIIRWVAEESRAFMPHFHVPLQSGSDEVLRLMRRRYDTDLFRSRMEMIKEAIPHAFIGVDVIAGARGETEEEWLRGYEFIASLPVSQLHVFPYSERPNTRALQLDAYDVPVSERHRRVNRLMTLSQSKYDAFRNSMLGSHRPVLWEQPRLLTSASPANPSSSSAPESSPENASTPIMHGFTDNYLRIEAPYRPELVNRVTNASLIEVIDNESIRGEIDIFG